MAATRSATGLVVAMLLATPTLATAQESIPAADAATSAPAARFHRLHAAFDALGLFDGRYTLGVEALTAENESFVLSGFYLQSQLKAPTTFTLGGGSGATYSTATQAFGGEFAYRRYFYRPDEDGSMIARAATGIFIAPGATLQHFTTVTTASGAANVPADSIGRQSFGYVGPSFDLGAQLTSTTGLVAAVSVGAHYRVAISKLDDSHYPWTWEASNGPGLRPRFRLEIGWAFL